MIKIKFRATQWIWFLILSAIIIAVVLDFFYNPGPASDWIMYVKASKLYLNGSPIYRVPVNQNQFVSMSVYSPLFSFLLIPVTFLNVYLSLAIWHFLKI